MAVMATLAFEAQPLTALDLVGDILVAVAGTGTVVGCYPV
jgi:hypothetical protein